MRRRLFAPAIATLALATLIAGAPAETESSEAVTEGCWTFDDAGTPDDTTDDTELCELETWFHRASTPAGNVEAVAAGQFPTWDTNPPAGSVTGGNGGGYAGNSVLDMVAPGDPSNAATFKGTYTGTLDNLAVSLYAWIPGRTVDGSDHTTHVIVELNGFPVLDRGDLAVTTVAGGDSTLRIDLAIDGLAELIDAYGFDNGPEAVHELTFKIGSWNYGFDEAIYLYDSTEVPSGIVFNLDPASFADYTVISAF